MPGLLHVLLIEDEPADADVVLRELRRMGFDPEVSITATEADYRAALEREPEVVISESSLPAFDGLSALRILRERDLDVPFILLTRALDDEIAAEYVRSGVTDYVLKDRPGRLGLAVTNALGLRRALEEGRQSRQALERSERYPRLIFENTQDLLLVLGTDGTPLFYSPSVLTTFGRTPEEFESRPVFEFIHPEDLERAMGIFTDAVEHAGTSRFVRFRMSHRDGSWRTIEARGKNLVHEPLVSGIVVTGRDVTDRVAGEAERALQAAALDATARAIVITNVDGRIVWVNPAFTRLTGYTREESIGQNPRLLKSGAQDPTFYEHLWRTIQAGETWKGELVNQRKDGTLYTEEQTITPVQSDGVIRHFIAIKQDVTERKRAEQQLRSALERATQSDRLKSAFLANMSHEIRTPLNVILGYNSLIADICRAVEDAEIDDIVRDVEKASRRLMKTVHLLLDVAGLETGSLEFRPVPLSLDTLIEGVVAEFRPAADEKGLELYCDIAEPGAVVSFDEYCLEQALSHLVDNAVKFTVEGRVVVSLGRDTGGTLLLTVEDTGVGIEGRYLPRLFRPFTQEEDGYTRKFEGNGLGLTLTKGYLELGGATIEVRSEKGSGTRFQIRLPRALETSGARTVESAAPEEVVSEPGSREGERPLVLIVEDDPETWKYMQTALAPRFRLVFAADADEARDMLKMNRDVRAILLDVSLRGAEDGLALTRELRKQGSWQTLPILAVTAHAMPEDEGRCLNAGCDGYLAKPVRPRRVIEALERLLAADSARGALSVQP